MKTSSEGSPVYVSAINPGEYTYDFENRLVASGTVDEGYVFAAPYSHSGWLAGTVPVNQEDFVLKASMADPPMFLASLLDAKLKASGIRIRKNPSTIRLEGTAPVENVIKVCGNCLSPPV